MMGKDHVLFFGCWGEAGHVLRRPAGRSVLPPGLHVKLCGMLDSNLAPRRTRRGSISWGGADSAAVEYPQGQFLRHQMLGYTILSWWDRCQGDSRPGSNSSIIAVGVYTSEVMLAALAEHFPTVIENLKRAGVELVEVFPLGGD